MSLKQIAKDVLSILECGRYQVDDTELIIAPEIESAIKGSRLYSPDSLKKLIASGRKRSPVIEVVDATTQSAAQSMARRGRTVLLNFASARNIGGGFLNGAKAQEEDLCRCSALYPTLLPHTEYYDANRSQKSLLYTDYAIFSPDVPFFKLRGTGEFLIEPFHASIITAPAPNSGPHLRSNPGDEASIEATFQRRWKNVLSIAQDQKIGQILLGAWGCGAFGGDPKMAARTAKQAIQLYGSDFERVVFAIPDRGTKGHDNFLAFRATFEE